MKAFILLTFFSATVVRSATMYSVVDLGSFGGGSSVAYRINNAGVAVGWSATPLADNHAFSTSLGSLQDLNQASASNSLAYDSNGSGQIAGTSYVDGQNHGSVWSGSGFTDLGAGTFAMSINSSGQVAGTNGHAFVYDNGKFTDLGTISGGNWTAAYGINDGGMVAGYGDIGNGIFRAFTWTAATGLKTLGTLGGGNSYAMAINNRGQVAGHSTVASGYEHAFVDNNGILTDLGTLGGGNSYAYDINDGGAVVGYSGADAFLYRGGNLSDLNSLIGSTSGWQLQQAYGINNAGQIVGSGRYQGQSHAFVLDPVQTLNANQIRGSSTAVPEPGSAMLFAAGLALLAIAPIRRAMRNL
ncbi:MAG: HAF repeat-containing protein [Bryobacteraceae bacterium]